MASAAQLGAPRGAAFLTTKSESGLTAEFSLATLASGLLKHAVVNGVSTPATAVDGTDYLSPLTGLKTADASLTLPTTVGQTAKFLRGDMTWQTVAAGTPGGSDTQLQYNDGSAFGGAAGLVYTDTTGQFAATLQADIASGNAYSFSGAAAGELTAASGSQTFLSITSNINQRETAGYTAFLVNAIETATGSGTKNLLDLQKSGVTRASINNNGAMTLGTKTGSAGGGFMDIIPDYDTGIPLRLRGGGDGAGASHEQIWFSYNQEATYAHSIRTAHAARSTFEFWLHRGSDDTRYRRLMINGDSGNVGVGTTGWTPVGRLSIANDLSSAAWLTTGIQLGGDAATYTDTGAAGTRATGVAWSVGIPTFAGTNAVTITDAAALYIAGAPAAGTNMTLTNPWALWVDAGACRFDGAMQFGTYSALAAETVQGYITITDAAGNSRKLAVVA